MKNAILQLFLASLFCIAASAEVNVDFDGKSTNGQANYNSATINELIGKSQEPPSVQPPYGLPAPAISVKMEVKSESGEWNEIKPVKKEGKANFYKFFPQDLIRTALSCTSNNSNPYPNYWEAVTTYRNLPSYAGHEHTNPPPPALKDPANQDLPNPLDSHTLLVNNNYVFDWFAPEYSTRITQEAQFSYACTGSIVLVDDIIVPGLRPMPAGQNYILYPPANTDNPYHPTKDTHYGTQKLIDTLTSIADTYHQSFSTASPIQINDMSLPWGGLFDIHEDWNPPHSLHRCGSQADIRESQIPQANREKFLEIACKTTVANADQKDGTVLHEFDPATKAIHYHISIRQQEGYPPTGSNIYYYCRSPKPGPQESANELTSCCNPNGSINLTHLSKCLN